jgi:hypothetical protein
MKVLLVGEFSGVHNNLADALRQLGHTVHIAATGDGYKQFPYDVYFADRAGKDNSFYKQLLKWRTKKLLRDNRNIFYDNDVIQFINPVFYVSDLLMLNIYAFNELVKHTKTTVLGAFGDDYVWVDACIKGLFRYDMVTENVKNHTPDEHLTDVLENIYSIPSKRVNHYIANAVNGIVAGAYEYYAPYKQSDYSFKTSYIPFPVNVHSIEYTPNLIENGRIKILMGKQKGRNSWKGMNVIENAVQKFADRYPDDIEVLRAESLPFNQYKLLYKQANVVIDQLYSYSPAMNALNALAAGKVVLGGGEKEMYALLNEQSNFPVFNIQSGEDEIIQVLNDLLASRKYFEELGAAGRTFVENHHDHLLIAQMYIQHWQALNR